jgi:hypothetical protein
LARKIAGANPDILTLDGARTFVQAEFGLARIRRVKVGLIFRIIGASERSFVRLSRQHERLADRYWSAAVSSIAVVCTVAISFWLSVAHDIEPARERRVTGIDDLGLRFARGRSDRANSLIGPLHGYPPPQGGRS